jgi:MbtH protein
VNEVDDDNRAYSVVVNDEEQYSIWLCGRDLPAGWRAVEVSGSKEECLAHIREVWTDITPLSVRRRLAAARVENGTQ